MAARIRVGTASWTDHAPFYPPEYTKKAMQSQRIGYYARYFSVVEVDSTFYRLQPQRSFEHWAEQTPDDFVFDVKAYGEMTWHHRGDDGVPVVPSVETFAQFSEMLQPLRAVSKLGAVLFQFPPWFNDTEEHRDYLMTLHELLPDDLLAVEFRNRTWLEGSAVAETKALLADQELAFCAVDEPQIGSGSVPPLALLTNPHFSMVRFHGRNRRMWYARNLKSSRDRFDYLYSQEELRPWTDRIERIAEQLQGSEVHVITNNNASNYAVVNAFDMQELFGQPVANGQAIPDVVLETIRERDQRDQHPHE